MNRRVNRIRKRKPRPQASLGRIDAPLIGAVMAADLSTEALARLLPSAAGRLMQAELEHLAKALDKPLRPVGEWNTSKIVVRGAKVEHWLNGKQTVEYAAAAKSSPIVIQHHNSDAWFRSIRIRNL